MTRWMSILIMLAALLTRADDRADELTAAGIAEFTAAYQAWDGQRFAVAADYFRKALARHPADHAAREGLARVAEKK